ncbi:MAG: iron-containing alcohol dehydrogenase [Acidobacteriota bacterium]|nr:MAG: iron-containing alcohol dehydrogenase [Acidobacteriota bacterium]
MQIAGQTNVTSIRFGSGSVNGIGKDLGRFVVATMELPWSITEGKLGADPVAVLMVESMEQEFVDQQVASAPPCDTVVGIGGGQAIDLAKYFAWKKGCRLVTIPTVISVDAFVTPAAAVRQNHRVLYVGESSPDPLIIDYDLIRTAPSDLNVAGAGDLLSIHTATFDWEVAHRAGKSEYPYSQDDIQTARAILETVAENASEIRALSDRGLRTIVEGYMRVNTICLPAGHYRVEEGSEHFLFYELEERLKKPFIHGQIVGLGIYVMSRLQKNRVEWITSLMDELGLRYQPVDMGIPKDAMVASLQVLEPFTRKRGLWYSQIQETPLDLAQIEGLLRGLRF